ncbi:MAG TPA: hypothetical protein VHF25_17260 [Nitriliruptorales bacterium]|nr:hypothetical protein [Nitriliruptorales bacterium]
MSRLLPVVLLAAASWSLPAAAWAHGVGVRGDLPLPLSVVVYGAVGVLLASFMLLVRLWPAARLEGDRGDPALSMGLSRLVGGLVWPGRLLGLLAFGVVLAAGLAGPLDSQANLAPFAIYVALWVGGMMVSGLVGDVWAGLNPFEAVAAGVRRLNGERGPGWLERAGQWPAVALLAAFVWLELVHPDPADPRSLAVAVAVYAGLIVLGAVWWGPRWVRAADAFGALFRLLAAMAPLHRGQDGRLRLRPPLVGLARLRPSRATAALVLVALGSTTFDGLTRTDLWTPISGGRTGLAAVAIGTLGLAATIAVVAGLYVWAMREAARTSRRTTGELVDRFAHSLVPIALGYAIAHYFSLLVFEGQRVVALASDPLGRGWDLFGTAGWSVDYTAVSTTTIAAVQVAAIVGGHVAGVVLAHDRAVALFPPEQAARSQHALLAAMVAYTVGGLLLLLGA